MPDFSNTDTWRDELPDLILQLGTGDFYQMLDAALSGISHLGNIVVFHTRPDSPPRTLYCSYAQGSEEYSTQIVKYLEGAYILDPYYQASVEGIPSGAYLLQNIAPDDFRNSEYYKVYYSATGVKDELSYIQVLEGNGHLQLSVVYTGPGEQIPEAIQALLLDRQSIINALLLRQWELYHADLSPKADNQFHDHLIRARDLFGSSILTRREISILQLILQGHSSKAAAMKFGISESTVKLHRKHIYKKLDIGSQNELFHLFMDSMVCFDPANQADPLAAYMGSC